MAYHFIDRHTNAFGKLPIVQWGGDGRYGARDGDGARVRKDALRVEAYGTVDEANAAIGIARLDTRGEADAMLAGIVKILDTEDDEKQDE